ncbi:hypothetical protein SAMN05444008_10365 [Cnuella takakiae]|uniref:Uncharacterized protein n=1 Tax=Cnuella takakiae TaxID=1302690 RepID=A0A1M4WLL6_9BACT|nr:hypothetical protein SAMN05444008_10365 [Cnuella takakiae]
MIHPFAEPKGCSEWAPFLFYIKMKWNVASYSCVNDKVSASLYLSNQMGVTFFSYTLCS